MPKTHPVTFKVTVGRFDIIGLLDMLRYERGIVENVAQERGDRLNVTITVDDDHRFQPARWKSFGITPDVQGSGEDAEYNRLVVQRS